MGKYATYNQVNITLLRPQCSVRDFLSSSRFPIHICRLWLSTANNALRVHNYCCLAIRQNSSEISNYFFSTASNVNELYRIPTHQYLNVVQRSLLKCISINSTSSARNQRVHRGVMNGILHAPINFHRAATDSGSSPKVRGWIGWWQTGFALNGDQQTVSGTALWNKWNGWKPPPMRLVQVFWMYCH